MLVTKFGELIRTALQIETWRPGGHQESVRSSSGVRQESVRSSSVDPFRFMLVTKFGELIWTALQIDTWCPGVCPGPSGVQWESVRVSQESVRITFHQELVSCYSHNLKRLLTDSWRTLDGHMTDSQWTSDGPQQPPHRPLTAPTDPQRTPDGPLMDPRRTTVTLNSLFQ